MTVKLKVVMMVFACCSYQSQAEDLNALKVKEYRLENGLTVWLNEDHSQPKVFGAVVVKAGAKDCPDTGIAHYFEHMMFKGTDRIGTLDYESEKVLLDSIAMKYDELAMTEDTAARARLQKEINELSIRSSEYVIPNEFNRLISRFGGSGLNAATSYDATIYFNTFSPQYMVQWAEINNERLMNPVFRLFQSELETVYEEKNMYGDFIGGQVMDTLMARYFGPHPYAYPIIGSTKNLKNPRLTEMRKFATVQATFHVVVFHHPHDRTPARFRRHHLLAHLVIVAFQLAQATGQVIHFGFAEGQRFFQLITTRTVVAELAMQFITTKTGALFRPAVGTHANVLQLFLQVV